MKRAKKLADMLAEAVAPVEYKCLNCGAEVFDQVGFCSHCLQDVQFNNGKTCLRCGVGIDGAEDYCGNCAFEKVYFDKAYSAFNYEGAIKHVILQLKFYNMGRYAKVLSRYLVFLAQKHNLQFDVVCYAPMTNKARKKRGYNQAQLLATYFCDAMDCDDKLTDALIKIKETERQEMLNKNDRKQNLVGSYKINADVKDKRVLVVDDVKTTGATLNECAKVLKRAGATSVVALTVASRKESAIFELEENQ